MAHLYVQCHFAAASNTTPTEIMLYIPSNILLLILQTSMSAVLIRVTPMLCVPISKAPLSVPATMDSLEMDSLAKVQSYFQLFILF